jgi:hypothetical protein
MQQGTVDLSHVQYLKLETKLLLFFGLVPLLLLSPPFFPIILFLSTTLLTGMTGISLHVKWPLTSQPHEMAKFSKGYIKIHKNTKLGAIWSDLCSFKYFKGLFLLPGGEDSGQHELPEGCDEVHGPVEGEEVEPLQPEALRRLLVLGELAMHGRTVEAGLENKRSALKT